jgi:hypothetical protein
MDFIKFISIKTLLKDVTFDDMPLFEMVGVSSISKTFNVAFAFIKNEKEENFIWVLQQCRSLMRSKGVEPNVTVTDRDTTLMNIVDKVFPDASPLICRYHVLSTPPTLVVEMALSVLLIETFEDETLCKTKLCSPMRSLHTHLHQSFFLPYTHLILFCVV